MKTALLILTFFVSLMLSHGEETPVEIARRVIRDKSSVYKNNTSTATSAPRSNAFKFLNPYENQLVEAADQSEKMIEEHILNNDTPEKVLLAYAIRILRSKRIIWQTNPNMLGIDVEKNEGYLEDGLKLTARLNEITKEAEQAGTGQPATRPESKLEGGDKPQAESEGRSR